MKKESIDVSVLVCTYNHEKYIRQAIESVLAQETDYRFELIIGDDASTDGTPDIVREYAAREHCIHPVLRKENIGATRNSYDLTKRARGRYIAALDGDDCFCNVHRVQKQVDFLEEYPSYSAVCGKCNLMDEDNRRIREDSLTEKEKFWKFDKEVFTWKDFEEWKMPGHISSLLGRNHYAHHVPKILYEAHDTVGDRTGVLLNLLHGPIWCTDDVNSSYRLRRDHGHFMSNFREQNLRGEDVHMMRRLEEYAHSMGRTLDLEKIKKHRLVGATCAWMKDPTKYNRDVIKRILDDCGASEEYRNLVVKAIVLKTFYWNSLGEDRPIEIN